MHINSNPPNMSKRSRQEATDGDVESHDAHKRVKEEAREAISAILNNSDELIQVLQALKGDTEKKRKLEKQLANLTHKLMPSLQTLAKSSKASRTESTVSEAVQEKPKSEVVVPVTQETPASKVPAKEVALPVPAPAEASADSAPKKGAEAPWFYLTTGWNTSDIQSDLPTLPIVNDDLKTAAFTHSAFTNNGTQLSYERLEWLGDAYLYVLSSAFIFQTFGSMPTGRCAQIRESLVKNATLAGYFRQYNMGQYARVPPERQRATQSKVPGSDKETIKVQGDMFEAFVAAVVLSSPEHGVSRVSQWLKHLWARTLEKNIRDLEKHPDILGGVVELGQGGIDAKINAKTRLATHIQVPGVLLQYKDLVCKKKDKGTNLSLYSIAVYLTGWGEKDKMIGMATALSKKEAGQKAALQALESTKLMKQYHTKKRAYLEARASANPSNAIAASHAAE